MTRDAALSLLRNYEPQLREKGVTRLRLFGSVARNQANSSSDVDLLADFDPKRTISLLDIVGIELDLAELTGTRVDLMEQRSLKPYVLANALLEAVVAF